MRDDLHIIRGNYSGPPPSEKTILFPDFLKNVGISSFFKYQNGTLYVADVNYISKPFFTSLILRWVVREECVWVDSQQNRLSISFFTPIKLGIFYLRDGMGRLGLMRRVLRLFRKRLEPLQSAPVDITTPPAYVFSDFSMGVRAGGSLGHVAGVFNQFPQQSYFYGTWLIPGLSSHAQKYVLSPHPCYWDFSEVPILNYNLEAYRKLKRQFEKERPSFIYHRSARKIFFVSCLAQELKIPLVLEFNGPEVWVQKQWEKEIPYESLTEEIENRNLNAAQLVVVVSEALKTIAIEKGVSPEKIVVIPNGVDPVQYSPEHLGDHIRKKYNIQNKVVVGFMGTFGKWHGAPVLAEAINQMNAVSEKVHFLFIGDGVELQKTKEIVGSNSAVTFTGLVPQKEGVEFLAACDILVAPHIPNSDGSPFFGSPTKLFEYMAMGKAIVASDLDQLGDIIDHEKNGLLVPPTDAHTLASALTRLVHDADFRMQLGTAARADVLAQYTWKHHVDKIFAKLKS